jgi:hypothetical protein
VIFRGKTWATTNRISIVVYTWCMLVLKHLNGNLPVGDTTANISPFLKQTLGITDPIPCRYTGTLTSVASATRSELGMYKFKFPVTPLNSSMMWKVVVPHKSRDAVRESALKTGADKEEVDRVSFHNSAKAFIRGSAIVPDAVGSIFASPSATKMVDLSALCPRVGMSQTAAMKMTIESEKREAESNIDQLD